MTGTMKWAFIGDLQIPYQDSRAVALWFKVMKYWKPDAIDIVGDIDDQLEYSRFSDGTTDEFFNKLIKDNKDAEKALKGEGPLPEPLSPLPIIKANADGAKAFYHDVRAANKNADLHASIGNHDIRVFDYVDRKFPDHVETLTPEFLWGLDNEGITWRMYHEKPLERFAGIYVHHGATTTDTGLAVRGDIEKYGISMVRGHDHRGGVVYKTFPVSGRALVGMGTGHMCDEQSYGMRYTFNHQWEKGFGIAHVVDDFAHLQFIRITDDYKCVVDGKKFEG